MKYAALVIALNEYDNNTHLINALNDGVAMASKFKELKYDVIELLGEKAVYSEYVNAVSELMSKSYTEKYDAVILYFSGHGFMAVAADYLALKDCHKLEYNGGASAMMKSVRVIDFIKTFHDRGVPSIIVILDACRDDISNYADEDGGIEEKTKGVEGILTSQFGTAIQAPFQSYIAFSTTATKKASDGGKNSGHSRYTAALLEEITKPIPIEQVFKNIRKKVHQKEDDQLPWEYSCLTDDFYFNYGQMDPYYNSPYPRECYEDSKYSSFNPEVTSIIQCLMSSHDSERGKGLFKFLMGGKTMSAEDQFVIGRVIMRQAIGGSGECIKFVTSRRLERYKRGKKNDLVNGILYDLYFDTENSYRPKRINDVTLLNSLSHFAQDDYCHSSVWFINQVLEERDLKPIYRIGNGLFYHVMVFVKRTDYHAADGEDIFYIHSVNFRQEDIKDDLELEPYLIEPRDLSNEISRWLQIPPIQLRVRIPAAAKHLLRTPIPDRFDEIVYEALVKEPVDEIDQLSTSGYSVDDCGVTSISDIQVEEDYIMVEGKCEASFEISFDEDVFSMSFPGSFILELHLEKGKWRNKRRNAFSFDTSKYYE